MLRIKIIYYLIRPVTVVKIILFTWKKYIRWSKLLNRWISISSNYIMHFSYKSYFSPFIITIKILYISLYSGKTMGFPIGYSELLLPKILFHLLFFLGLVRKRFFAIFRVSGLPYFSQPDPGSSTWHDSSSVSFLTHPDAAAMVVGEMLPIVRFSDLDRPESEYCAVCLYDFETDDEIRRLTNCRHIYHRGCLDRWLMGYNQMTCPLCRKHFIRDDLQDEFDQRLWSEFSGVYE